MILARCKNARDLRPRFLQFLFRFSTFFCLSLASFIVGAESDFPEKIAFTHEGHEITLVKNGEALREFIFIDIYRVAHYSSHPLPELDPSAAVLAGSFTKQLSIIYQRDLSANRVKKVLREGFVDNASAGELKSLEKDLNILLQQLTKDISDGDKLVIRWFTNGLINFRANGRLIYALQNPLFARILWSIWLGDKSVVNREDLLSDRD